MSSIDIRAKAREVLKEYRNRRGDLDVRKVSEETYILVYGMEKRLEAGDLAFQKVNEQINRCPVLTGQKSFKDAHGGFRLSWKQFIALIIVVAVLSTGGVALAYVTRLGGV